MGCKHGAKWMGYYAAEEAEEYGCEIMTYTEVTKVIEEKGRAVGVFARGLKNDELYELRGDMVILSAGGAGSAVIMQHSGVPYAGMRIFGDPSFSTYALYRKMSDTRDSCMSTGRPFISWMTSMVASLPPI